MTLNGQDDRAARLRRAIDVKRAARSGPSTLPPRPADEPPRLGDMQRSLWLLHEMEPRACAYNLTSAFRLTDRLDHGRLDRSLNAMVTRHRLLRSTFQAQRATVLQVVHPHAPLKTDVIQVEPGEGLNTAVRLARMPFDLKSGPLIRLAVIEDPSGPEHLIVLVLHHILADERSLTLLWDELADGYNGRPPQQDVVPQFDDYVHWQTSRAQETRGPDLEYWRRQLDPLPDELTLPVERLPREEPNTPGRLLWTRPSKSVQTSVRRLASLVGTTPFVAFAYVFRLLLARYGQGPNIGFATPVSTRAHPAAADMLGYFLNPVVILASLDERQSVRESLGAFSRSVREALAHAATPFDVLAEQFAPARARDRHPLFQTMFVYQETAPPPPFGDVRLETVALDLGESKFDFTCFVTESNDSLEVGVEYRTDRFTETWIQGLLDHYTALLEHVTDDLERPAANIRMLSPTEESQLFSDWQGKAAPPTDTDFLPGQILAAVERSRQVPAVVSGGEQWSYHELGEAAGRIAAELRRRGVRPGDRVGLFIERSTAMIAAVIGCHAAGAAYVPLDPTYPPARTNFLLEDSEVSAVLTTTSGCPHLPEGSWSVIDVDAVPDTEGNDTALSELHAESPAYVLYTSGSTGRPKGVVVTHGNLRASNAARLLSYDARPNRFLLLPSVAFDSSVAGIFWTLASGGTLVIPDDEEVKDPHRLTELVAHERVSTLLCVPSLYASMLAAGGSQLSGLTTAIVAGERCPSQLVRSHFRTIPGVRLFNEYGPTEATVWATVHEIREPDAKDPVPIGRPIPGVQVHVLDTLGRAVPAGVPGRGWIAGPTVSGGYWKQPSLTGERFVVGASAQSPHQRMYDSGDRLTWASDGTLLFLGREDDQIKLRGYRVEPGEIEAALTAQPGIEDAAVVSSGSASAAQLVAFVRLTSAAAARDHRQGLENQLPSFMVPQRVVEVPDLPRLPNGKLDRAQLEQMALDLPVFAAGDEPTTALEEALVSLWKGLLDRPNLGTTDNFVELGGHSLLVVEMTDNIARDHGVTLTAADVFQNPTVKELARQIEQQGRPARYTHLFPLQPGGRETPFIMAIPHFFSEMLAERFRGERPVYGLRGVGIRTEGNAGRWRTMTDLGEELVEEIERRFPDEPCLVGGYSFGASMAFEVARLMEQRGNPAKRLYMIAPMALDVYRLGPWRVQLNGLRGATTDLSLGEALRLLGSDLNPLTRLPYQRASQLLAVRPWRRLLASVGRLYRSAGRPLPGRVLNADVRAERFRLHRGYRPQAIRTPTVMFNPTDGETDAAATWRPYFEGRLTICDTPDPHHDAESVSAAQTVILQGLRDLDDR